MPRTTIKRQALAGFVVDITYPTTTLGGAIDKLSMSREHKKDDKPTDPNNMWSLRMDASSNVNGSGAGSILESPIGETISYALRLKFPASNNEAEYEVLQARLQLAKEIRAEQPEFTVIPS